MTKSPILSSIALLSLLAISTSTQFNAQEAKASPPAASQNRCGSPEYLQMDFILGTWEVSNKGKKTADVTIERTTQSDCGLIEIWKSANGGGGNGLFAQSPVGHSWQYFWVPASGQPTWLHDGKSTGADAEMQFTLTRTLADGTSHESHWTLTKTPTDQIRELSVNLQTGATEYDLLWTKKQ